MKNLKITINLATPVILNRYTTIDSILLALHFNKLRKNGKINNSFIDTEKYIQKNKNDLFLKYKNGVLSGSIWYMYPDDKIILENVLFSKKIDTKEIYEITGKKVDIQRGEFKAFRFGLEAMRIPKIYFYVKGNKEYIEELLKDLKYVGKKASVGFGLVNGVKVEEVEKDKSFMLDETTPAKPLPLRSWYIKSKKVAFYRALPPYYEKKDLEACYMPTRALIELKDNSYNNDNFKVADDLNYVGASEFARKYTQFEDVELFKTLKKDMKYLTDNKNNYCVICGSKANEGILGNPKKLLPKSFNDYGFLDKGNFICSNCLWSMKQEKVLGNTFISKDKFIYLQGGKMDIKGATAQQKFRDEFFRNLDLLKPPFLISLKSTANSQHTVFKNKVAISNAMIPISFGVEEEILVDVELLKEAIKDMEEIIKNNKCIKKPHLLGLEKINNIFPKLSRKCLNKENLAVIQNFWKKYDRSIRKILNRIILN